MGAGMRRTGLGPRSDVVFAVSNGVVSSYNGEGRLNWQDRRGPRWTREGQLDELGTLCDFKFTLEGRSSHVLVLTLLTALLLCYLDCL